MCAVVVIWGQADTIGMDAHSIDVPLDDGRRVRVDVPMRSFQGGESFVTNQSIPTLPRSGTLLLLLQLTISSPSRIE